MADIICEGPITKQHLETLLQNHFKTSNKIVKAQGEIISDGQGFTSDIMRVDLEWETKSGLPCRIIAKAPKMANIAELKEKFTGEGAQQAIDKRMKFEPMIHETECRMYKMFAANPPMPMPKFYWSCLVTDDHPGLILMEDLGARAGILDNIATGLSLGQWRNCLNCLADLYAWSLTTTCPWLEEVGDRTNMDEFFKSFQATSPQRLKLAMETYPEYFGHVNYEKVLKVITFENILDTTRRYKKYMQDVLVHGDTWVNNIMFDKNSDGTLSDNVAAFIDWQICMKGSIVNDLTRLSSWCVSAELRRSHERDLLQGFYDRIKSKTGDRLTLTFDQLLELNYSLQSLYGLVDVLMVDIMLSDIAKVQEDETGRRKIVILERVKDLYDDAAKFYGW